MSASRSSATDAVDLGEGWLRYLDGTRRPYYFNQVTAEVTWDHRFPESSDRRISQQLTHPLPVEDIFGDDGGGGDVAAVDCSIILPPGWSEWSDSTGAKYYTHDDGTSTWTKPGTDDSQQHQPASPLSLAVSIQTLEPSLHSTQSSRDRTASAMFSNILSFPDQLTAQRVSLDLDADGELHTPKELRASIMRPLEFIMAEACNLKQRSSLCHQRRQQELPSLGCIFVKCSARGRVRLMFRCVAFACQRLATAPADTHMARMSWSWAEMVMERVTRGRVKRVQVRLRAMLCAALVVPVPACAVCLTRAAGNGGWF